MKRILFIVLFLSICINANAYYYTVNNDNKVLAVTEYLPDETDLASREEIAVYSEEIINLEQAEYRNGKIIVHKKTSDELDAEIEFKEKQEELKKINNRVKLNAFEVLKAEGEKFKHIKETDFE